MKKDEKEWLVSDESCLGCMYYGYFDTSARVKACLYTIYTQKIRKCKPSECTVKVMGKRPAYEDELRMHRQHPKKKEGA